MSQTIVRVYDSEAKAQQAVDGLLRKGFGADLMNLVAPRDPAQSLEDIAAAIRAGYVLKGYAKAYAACVARGLTVVSMRAPFGTGVVVTRVMDAAGPVPSGVPEQHEAGPTWDEAAPLSSALNLPVLTQGSPTFSGLWLLPLVLREGKRSGTLFPVNFKRGHQAAPFSALLGLPLLSKKRWTFSSLLGMPLLVNTKR